MYSIHREFAIYPHLPATHRHEFIEREGGSSVCLNVHLCLFVCLTVCVANLTIRKGEATTTLENHLAASMSVRKETHEFLTRGGISGHYGSTD